MPQKGWTAKKAIEYGIKMEENAIGFYTKLMNTVKSPGPKQFLKEIIIYKKNHKRIFEETLRKPDELAAYCALPKEMVDYKVIDNLGDVDVNARSTYQDLLIFASRTEQKSHDFYMFMAKEFKGRDIGEIFACFAREDLEHKLMLEKEYDTVVLAEN